MNEAKSITIERNGQRMEIAIPPGFIRQLSKNQFEGFTYVRYPTIVDSISPKAKFDGPALQKGDTLLTFNNKQAYYFTDLANILKDSKFKKLNNISVEVTVLRNGKDTIHTKLLPVREHRLRSILQKY